MSTIEFRRATLADVGDIVALVESAYRGEASKAGWTTEADLLAGQRTDAGAVTAIIESPGARFVLAVDAERGETLGCCHLERRDKTLAYFGMFAVRPGSQGGGVGKLLLAEAERQAHDEWGVTTMEMTVIAQREVLISWYVRHGYAPTGETRPFPYGDERFGRPLRDDLRFAVLAKRFG